MVSHVKSYLLIVSLMIGVRGDAQCPALCRCTSYAADCRSAGLTFVPKFPRDITSVDLSGNRITRLANGSFLSVPLLESLDLSNNGIRSIELGALIKLESLVTLNLSHNFLQEADFADHELFRGCRLLRSLDLSYNTFNSVPDRGLKVLTNLRSLHMQKNDITSAALGPDFKYLELLEYIDLSGNRFQSVASHSFQSIRQNKRLQVLNLSDSDIRTLAHDVFTGLDSLVHVDLSDNPRLLTSDLNVSIAVLCQSADLASLRLSNANITSLSGLLRPLMYATRLDYLDLSRNEIRVIGTSDIPSSQTLKRLDLSRNKIDTLSPFRLETMQELDLSHNLISELEEQHFENMGDLQWLDLSDNKLETFDSTPFSMNGKLATLNLSNNLIAAGQIVHLEELKTLILHGNQITDPTPFLVNGLEVLDLGYNLIRALPADLMPLTFTLDTLNLTHNRIETIDVLTFSKFTPSTVDLSYNRLQTVDDYGWTNVQNLDLKWNAIKSISETALAKLQWLSSLDLSNNKLTSLPAGMFRQLRGLQHLDLSDNSLGVFTQSPAALSIFDGGDDDITLVYLSLRANNIESLPPAFFSNLSRLHSLDLSHNKLREVTSSHLQGLGLLHTLDLSYNDMTAFNTSAVTSLVSLKKIDLSFTKWTCDCSIADVKRWLESESIDAINYNTDGHYSCATPDSLLDKPLSEFSPAEDSCNPLSAEKTIILSVIGCTAFVVLVVAGIVFWQHRWRLKRKLKKQHYRTMYERSQVTSPSNMGVNHVDYHNPNVTTRVNCVDNHHHNSAAFV